MRKRPTLRPQFEAMESLTLLSATPFHHALAPGIVHIDAKPKAPPKPLKLSFSGAAISGQFGLQMTPRTQTYTITNANVTKLGSLPTSLQNAAATGSIALGTNKAGKVTSLKKGSLTIADGANGTITLTLSNPSSQGTFNYKLTNATGEFKGDRSSGKVNFRYNSTGTFVANFLT